MAELCLSTATFKPQIYTLIFSNIAHYSRLFLSHPLCLSYFIFFAPCLLKLVSFLSPLFITTSLLLILLGLDYNNSAFRSSEPRASLFLSKGHVILQCLREKFGCESQKLCNEWEEFEAYKFLFASNIPTSDLVENPSGEECLVQTFDDKEVVVNVSANIEVKTGGEVHQTESANMRFMEEERLQDLFQGLDDFDDNIVEKAVDPLSTKSIKVVKEHVDKSKVRKGFEVQYVNVVGNEREGQHTRKVMPLAQPFQADDNIDNGKHGSNLGSYGSMRKEKEWKRTLACKLFEERHNAIVEGDEGIDALWERHESEDLNKSMRMATHTYRKNAEKAISLNLYGDEDDEDDEKEEFEITKVQLCCLQAFKFSARKMNLGMGRPNLVKFSKALKGVGWLHHVKKHGKKEIF